MMLKRTHYNMIVVCGTIGGIGTATCPKQSVYNISVRRQWYVYLWVSCHLVVINGLPWIQGLQSLDLKQGSKS